MALPSIVQQVGLSNTAAGDSLTLTLASTTIHNLLLCSVEQQNNSAVTMPANWTQVDQAQTGTARTLTLYQYVNNPGSITSLLVQQATSGPLSVKFIEVGAALTASPLDKHKNAIGTSTQAVSLTTAAALSQPGEFVYAVIGYNIGTATTFTGVSTGFSALTPTDSTNQAPNTHIQDYWSLTQAPQVTDTFAATAGVNINWQAILAGFEVLESDFTQTETATGTESLSASITAPLTESATGDDSQLAATLTAPLTESATGAESLPVSVTTPLTETATGNDSQTTVDVLADSATGSDASLTATITAPTSDAASGTESLPVGVTAPLSESASGTEAVSASLTVPQTDAGTGSDSALATTITAPASDAGAGAESLPVSVSTPTSDAASGTESLPVQVGTPQTDAGVGAESLPIAVGVGASDAATGAEAVPVQVGAPGADAGAGAEGLPLTIILPTSSDTGVGADSETTALPPAIVMLTATRRSAVFGARRGRQVALAHRRSSRIPLQARRLATASFP